MDLLTQIMECKEEEIDEIISKAIEEKNQESEKVEKLGFLDYGKANYLFKGFIPLNTRIKYSSMCIEDYGMETTDFMYEFAHFLKQYNINNKGALIYNLEYFVNSYFGMPHSGKTDREQIFNIVAWETATTDEEYFQALENNKIGDLKQKGVAECTERSALAQQILSLFGTESYYCMGCVDLGDKQEGHCFNIVKRKNDYALLDYSCPISAFRQDGKLQAYYPFVGSMSNKEFEEFVNTGKIKGFENYEMIDRKRIPTDGERLYVVGEFSIDKEKYKSSNSLGKEVVSEMSDTTLEDETERDMEAQEKLLQQSKDDQNQSL